MVAEKAELTYYFCRIVSGKQSTVLSVAIFCGLIGMDEIYEENTLLGYREVGWDSAMTADGDKQFWASNPNQLSFVA